MLMFIMMGLQSAEIFVVTLVCEVIGGFKNEFGAQYINNVVSSYIYSATSWLIFL